MKMRVFTLFPMYWLLILTPVIAYYVEAEYLIKIFIFI